MSGDVVLKHSAVQPGQCLLGRYYIERLLGEGGMGQVFLCHDSVRQGRYALKVIHPHLAPLEEVRRRFLQELKVTERLTHQGIVRTYSLEHHPSSGLLFFTMEYLEGHTIEDLLHDALEMQQKPPLSLLEIARILKELCGILTYAHAQGVIHRDIKPPNVMITRTGELKLMDFGIAKLLGDAQVRHTGFQGTVYYMAPEQLQGGALVTPAADVFSLGILAYQLITGEIPMGAVPPPSYYIRSVSSQVDAVVMKAIAPKPHARQPTPYAFWTELAKALQPILTLPGKMFPSFPVAAWRDVAEPTWRTDELLAPLDQIPPHPALEHAMSVSSLMSNDDGASAPRHRAERRIRRTQEYSNWSSYGSPSLSRDPHPGDEPTQVDFSSSAQTSFPKTPHSQHTLSEDEYPKIRSTSAVTGAYHHAYASDPGAISDDTTIVSNTPHEDDVERTNVELRQTATLGAAFSALEVVMTSDEKTVSGKRPRTLALGEHEAADTSSVQTFRTATTSRGRSSHHDVLSHANIKNRLQRLYVDAKSTPESQALSSRRQPSSHTLQPFFFSDSNGDEILALEQRYPVEREPVHNSTHSASPSSLSTSSSVHLSSVASLAVLEAISLDDMDFMLSSQPAYTATSLPAVVPPLQSKLFFSRRGECLLELVKIPAGTFLMGSNASDPFVSENETPQRLVHLDSYWIARTPVTNRMWQIFVEESLYQCEDPDYLKHWVNGQPPPELLEHPVVYISMDDLKQFCAFYGLQIPSEAQWERASRGDKGTPWPWGDTPPDPSFCNFFDAEINTTTPVGMYPEGISPYGLFDCCGNVWEWCMDEWSPNWLQLMGRTPRNPVFQLPMRTPQRPILYAIRGGCYLYRTSGVRCAFRYKSAKRAPYIGARVVKAGP